MKLTFGGPNIVNGCRRFPAFPSLDLTQLTRPQTDNGYNHLSRLQRRARAPSHHLSRRERAFGALRRLHLSLLSPPMVRPRFISLTPHCPRLTRPSVRPSCHPSGLTFPSLYEYQSIVSPFMECSRSFVGLRRRCPASGWGHSL